MPENYRFKSEVTHDLPTFKEFDRSASAHMPVTIISKIVLILVFLFYLVQIGDPFYAGSALVCIAILVLIWLITFLKNRKGTIHYKRQLAANQGQPLHVEIYFCEDGIHAYQDGNQAAGSYNYDQIRNVVETPNLLILMMQYRIGIILRKDTLSGGTQDDFTAFLGWHCPNWKSGTIHKGIFSKVLDWIILAVLVLTLILGICNLPSIRLFDGPSGTLTNDMTYQQMAQELTAVGITISDQAIEELEEFDAQYIADYGEEYYEDNYSASKVFDLLYWEATGFYDEETWEWTPSQSGIYYFDTEAWNVDAIYTDFFTGLSCMHSELNFTDVREDYSSADLADGTGQITVEFTYGGEPYSLTAEYYYDWFDTAILSEVGSILAADSSENQLWVYYDGQCCLLYYGTESQTAQLEEMTGLDFESAAGN